MKTTKFRDESIATHPGAPKCSKTCFYFLWNMGNNWVRNILRCPTIVFNASRLSKVSGQDLSLMVGYSATSGAVYASSECFMALNLLSWLGVTSWGLMDWNNYAVVEVNVVSWVVMVVLQNYKCLLNILGLGASTSNRRTSIANSHIFSKTELSRRRYLYCLPSTYLLGGQ